MLPDGICAIIDHKAWEIPKIFIRLQEAGDIPVRDMYNTYNMGIGMVVAVPEDTDTDGLLVIGRCESGEGAEIQW
jgi:phosphoribosylformylglycinamidine cyclo-ligase